MAYTSTDDMTAELAAGKSFRTDFFKLNNVAHVAGNCYDLSIGAGVPVANTYPGTALNAVAPTEATRDFPEKEAVWRHTRRVASREGPFAAQSPGSGNACVRRMRSRRADCVREIARVRRM